MQNIPDAELNDYIVSAPTITGVALPPAKTWRRIDVSNIETYVGDELYVVAVVSHKPNTTEAMKENALKAEAAVITYLQSEGFIGERYFFICLQSMELDDFLEM